MENFTIAGFDILEFFENRKSVFKFFELFSQAVNLKLKYVFWGGCNDTEHSEIDAYVANYFDFRSCSSLITVPPVIEYQSLGILVPSYLKQSKSALFGIFDILFKLVSLIILLFFIALQIFIAKFRKKTLNLSTELLYGLGFQTCQSCPINSKSSLLRSIYISMSLLGLLSQNCYTINISAYLVKGIDDSSIDIACGKHDIGFIKLFYPKVYKKFSFIAVQPRKLIKKINEIDIKTGICIRSYGWMKRLNSEMRNKHEIYRRASPWMTGFDPISVAFLNTSSKYSKELNEFVLKMYSYGFMVHWDKEITVKNYSKRRREIKSITDVEFKATLKDYRANFFHHVILLIISTLAFFSELLWSRIKRRSLKF